MEQYNSEQTTNILGMVFRHHPKANPKHFCGAQPCSIEKKDLSRLSQYDYALTEKTDGNRCLLVAHKGRLALIDRGNRVYKVPRASIADNEGSVLDGEYCPLQERFIIHDCVAYQGRSLVEERDLWRRLSFAEMVVGAVKSTVERTDGLPFIVVKRFYRKNEITEALLNECVAKPDTDGIVLTPVGLGIRCGRDNALLKWKPADKNTFDFVVCQTEGHYILYDLLEKTLTKAYEVAKNTPSGVAMTEWFKTQPIQPVLLATTEKEHTGVVSDCIVEFAFSKEKAYYPIRVRLDKTHPNARMTVYKTHLNIRENITLKDLWIALSSPPVAQHYSSRGQHRGDNHRNKKTDSGEQLMKSVSDALVNDYDTKLPETTDDYHNKTFKRPTMKKPKADYSMER